MFCLMRSLILTYVLFFLATEIYAMDPPSSTLERELKLLIQNHFPADKFQDVNVDIQFKNLYFTMLFKVREIKDAGPLFGGVFVYSHFDQDVYLIRFSKTCNVVDLFKGGIKDKKLIDMRINSKFVIGHSVVNFHDLYNDFREILIRHSSLLVKFGSHTAEINNVNNAFDFRQRVLKFQNKNLNFDSDMKILVLDNDKAVIFSDYYDCLVFMFPSLEDFVVLNFDIFFMSGEEAQKKLEEHYSNINTDRDESECDSEDEPEDFEQPLITLINEYCSSKSDPAVDTLAKIEKILERDRKKYACDSLTGRQLRAEHYSLDLIKLVHRSNQELLIELFSRYLGLPPVSLFEDGDTIPLHISQYEQQKKEAVQAFFASVLAEGKLGKSDILSGVITLQRAWRAGIRKKEHRANIFFTFKDKFPDEYIEKRIRDSHRPYLPKCDAELKCKLVRAALEVRLWPTVRHLTSREAIASIFDDGLLGRRNLLDKYMKFNKASLQKSDIKRSDGNMTCCGPDEIDLLSHTQHTAEIIFDFAALRHDKVAPNFIFKPLDLGMRKRITREIHIGSKVLQVGPLGLSHYEIPAESYFFGIRTQEGYRYEDQSTPYCPSLFAIFHNSQALDPILALHFFLFVDQLPPLKKDMIYDALRGFSHETLKEILTEIGTKTTASGELNYFGYFMPLFEYVLELNYWQMLNDYDEPTLIWKMKIADLSQELKEGKTGFLDRVAMDMPQLLKSHSFKEFVLSKVTNSAFLQLYEKYFTAIDPSLVDTESNK